MYTLLKEFLKVMTFLLINLRILYSIYDILSLSYIIILIEKQLKYYNVLLLNIKDYETERCEI